jgi:hypothetical protein
VIGVISRNYTDDPFSLPRAVQLERSDPGNMLRPAPSEGASKSFPSAKPLLNLRLNSRFVGDKRDFSRSGW